MTQDYLRIYDETLRHIRSQTDHEGPWRILVATSGGAPVLFEETATLGAAFARAYRLSGDSPHHVLFLITIPGDPTVLASFRGLLPRATNR